MESTYTVKSIRSEMREKQSLTRGDVLGSEGPKAIFKNSSRRGMRITLRFTASEAEELRARAAALGLRLSPYIRRLLVSGEQVSRETSLVLAELGRVRELMTRLWAAASEQDLAPDQVYQIADKVDAIDARLLVMRAKGTRR
jgi:predicted DNA binding CopG/RHH family protein